MLITAGSLHDVDTGRRKSSQPFLSGLVGDNIFYLLHELSFQTDLICFLEVWFLMSQRTRIVLVIAEQCNISSWVLLLMIW